MAAITEGTILRIVAVMLFPDSVVLQNVFCTVLTTVVGDNDSTDIVEDMVEYIEDIYTELTDAMDEDVDPSEVIVYEYDAVDDDFDEVGSDVFSIGAGTAGTLLPHGVAALVNFNTTDPDIQGKKYFGGLIEEVWIQSEWNAATLADLALAGAAIVGTFTATITGNIYQPAVWSPTNTVAVPYSGTILVPTAAAYQRRRKPGVGV